MTLGELYAQPQPGTADGSCYLCGRETDVGWREPPSSSFTAWAACGGGSVHCEFCRSLLKTSLFRFYSWVLDRSGLHLRDKEHRSLLWDTLLDPPEGPWAAYQTNAGQKQGWISVAVSCNESRSMYCVGVDWLDAPVMMRRQYAREHAPIITALRVAQVTLASLRSGSWSMHDYQRAQLCTVLRVLPCSTRLRLAGPGRLDCIGPDGSNRGWIDVMAQEYHEEGAR
jgi:hypothetical protein